MKIVYKNRLPHISPIGAMFFVTFRLGDSLPQGVIKELKFEMEEAIASLKKENPPDLTEKIQEQKSLFFKRYDHQLDSFLYGKCYLQIPEVADIVKDKLHERDKDKYELMAYTIMPNHVHMLLDTFIQIVDSQGFIMNSIPSDYMQLNEIMRLIKGSTAYHSNRVLKRGGRFWQKDSFDHYVRSEEEMYSIISYILQNPVKAGLVKKWQDYPYSYVNEIVNYSF